MEDKYAQIVELRKQGYTRKQVMAKLGVCNSVITKAQNAVGLKLVHKGVGDRNAEIYKLFKEGMSREELAVKYGMTKGSINNIIWQQKNNYVEEVPQTDLPILFARPKPRNTVVQYGGKKYVDITNEFAGYGAGSYD